MIAIQTYDLSCRQTDKDPIFPVTDIYPQLCPSRLHLCIAFTTTPFELCWVKRNAFPFLLSPHQYSHSTERDVESPRHQKTLEFHCSKVAD